jgi:hypothetical protein
MMIEGKLSTATSLSAGRYLLMNSLGLVNDDGSCISKVDGPVRSKLHAYGIKRLMLFSLAMSKIPKGKLARACDISGDSDVQELLNVGMDIRVTIPPIFSRFKLGAIPLRAAICEIYLHMTYHKDRSNPTHDERRILNKILKCQYDWKKSAGRYESNGCGHSSDEDYVKTILSECVNSYKYSARSVNIASKLQRKQCEHQSGLIDGYSRLFSHESINFNFSELSLFKSSVSCAVQNCASSFPQKQSSGEFKNIRQTVILTLKEMFTKFGMPLDGPPDFISSIGELSQHLNTIYCQIFKKNQITGVREIHILDIVSRCFARFRENISRTIIATDRREMLTKGDEKFTIIKIDMRNFIRSCPENLPVHVFHFSEDMTTWAQRFVIQSFCQLLKPHSKVFSRINSWSQFILSKFEKKRIELPAKLLEEISKKPDMFYGEDLSSMNSLKKQFLALEVDRMIV